ncbi:hypothetical protein BDV37DRAFT_265631 [Aspergillus pseudonomiae]|uniref:MACPF domain-containing protein n=1 Tax=Aspergillus pseudonomiae TaxID=1506151 RepID=A0A5N7CV05_9EURO|nr:uncharacterized protein BDV37DRAFT_265631 [Aspergillus pseudonomiae]KAE8397433.1 hypothetical protein BDV37DRAFT_265631 [Aspergillus pseudonomiae]
MAKTGTTVQLPGDEKLYLLPENVSYRYLGTNSSRNDLICEMGSELAPKLGMNMSLSGRYAGISILSNSQHSYEPSLQFNSLYGIYSLDQQSYRLYLDRDRCYSFINPDFINAAEQMPFWDESLATYQVFKSFFEVWGTHLVVQCHMGSRYQLKVEREQASHNMRDEFTAHIKAEYQGIMGDSYGVDNEDEYRQHLKMRRTQCKVLGGDAGYAAILANDPASKEAFQNWQSNRCHTTDAMTNNQVQRLDTFLQGSSNSLQKRIGENLAPALDYFCNFMELTGKLKFIPVSARNERLQWAECKITYLPGMELIPENKMGWRVTRISPAHVKYEQCNSDEDYLEASITIRGPTHIVDILFNGGLENGSASLFRYLLLSSHGPKPDQFCTRVISKKPTGHESVVHVSPSLKTWGDFLESESVAYKQGLEHSKEHRIGEILLRAR